MNRLFACLALAVLAAPAAACLNDIELPNHEREFRSQYNRSAPPPSAPATESADPGSFPLLFGGGTVLLIGAVGLTATGGRKRK